MHARFERVMLGVCKEIPVFLQKIAQRVELPRLILHEVVGRQLVQSQLQHARVPAAAQHAHNERPPDKIAELFMHAVHAGKHHLRRNRHVPHTEDCFAVAAAAAAFGVALPEIRKNVAAQAGAGLAVAGHVAQPQLGIPFAQGKGAHHAGVDAGPGLAGKPGHDRVMQHGQELGRRAGQQDDQLAAFRQKHLGFVFQSYNLLKELTAVENVAMPLMFRGIDKETRELEAKKMLCRVGLKNRMDHFPGQMSGGQQQRAGIARAFISRPDIVFADEPTGNLDSKTTREVMEMIHKLNKEDGRTIVMVTHNEEQARQTSRTVRFFDGRQVM